MGHGLEDAHVRLGAHRLKRGGEQGSSAALDDLGTGHQRPVTTVVGDHVARDVGVAHDGHDARQGHHEDQFR